MLPSSLLPFPRSHPGTPRAADSKPCLLRKPGASLFALTPLSKSWVPPAAFLKHAATTTVRRRSHSRSRTPVRALPDPSPPTCSKRRGSTPTWSRLRARARCDCGGRRCLPRLYPLRFSSVSPTSFTRASLNRALRTPSCSCTPLRAPTRHSPS